MDTDELSRMIDDMTELRFAPFLSQLSSYNRDAVIAALNTLNYMRTPLISGLEEQIEAEKRAELSEQEAEDRHIREESRQDIFI